MHILQLILPNCKYLGQIICILLKTDIFLQTHISPNMYKILVVNTGRPFSKLTIGRNSVMISVETICISFTWCSVKGIFLRF